MNVGKCVLKAIWECKKLLLNKNALKQIMIEAQAAVKEEKPENDSDEGTSSEEEAEPPTSANAKKVIEKIIEDQSPSPRKDTMPLLEGNESPNVDSR